MELPDEAFKVSHDGRRATLDARDVCVLDSFQFGGPINVPARVSFKVQWEATGPRERRGQGSAVPATDPAAFLGRFATARSTGEIESPARASGCLGEHPLCGAPERPT